MVTRSTFEKYGKQFTYKKIKDHKNSFAHADHVASAVYDCQHLNVVQIKDYTICKDCTKIIDSAIMRSGRAVQAMKNAIARALLPFIRSLNNLLERRGK